MKNSNWKRSSRIASTLLLVVALSFVFTESAIGQDGAANKDEASIKDGASVEPQDDTKELKREIAKLKREVARLKEQLEIAEHNGFYWPGKKAVGSPLALLKDLPRDLELKRNGSWGKFDLADVNEHLGQSKGQAYAARMNIKLGITESDQRDVFNVSVRLLESGFTYNGHSFTTRYHASILPSKYLCDSDTVDKLRKINLKKPVPVSAVISAAYVRGKYFYLSLKDIKLNRIELP